MFHQTPFNWLTNPGFPSISMKLMVRKNGESNFSRLFTHCLDVFMTGYMIPTFPCCRELKRILMPRIALGSHPGFHFITGALCEERCPPGHFGPGCSSSCSDHSQCANGAKCHFQSGHCDCSGVIGFTGDRCDEKCDQGWYGHNCSNM